MLYDFELKPPSYCLFDNFVSSKCLHESVREVSVNLSHAYLWSSQQELSKRTTRQLTLTDFWFFSWSILSLLQRHSLKSLNFYKPKILASECLGTSASIRPSRSFLKFPTKKLSEPVIHSTTKLFPEVWLKFLRRTFYFTELEIVTKKLQVNCECFFPNLHCNYKLFLSFSPSGDW